MRPDLRLGEERRKGERGELDLFTRKAVIAALVVIALVFLFFIRRILILIFIAGVLAAGIGPAVRRLRVLIRLYTGVKIRRGLAVLLVYLPFLITILAVLFFGVPLVISESEEMATQLPKLIDEKLVTPLGSYLPADQIRPLLYRDWSEAVPVYGYLRGAAQLLASVAAVLFLVAYMLIDAERLRNIFLLFYPPSERSQKRRMVQRASQRMSRWLAGQLILAGIIGLATFVVLFSLRIPYALPLALLAALGEMIPIIGPIVGAIPAVVIALFQSNWKFWAVLIAAILIQQIENYFLVPRVMGQKVSVSPLAVFIAFMIGGSLLGIIGAIMAIPAVAIATVAFEEGFVSRRERRLDSTRPGTLARTDQE